MSWSIDNSFPWLFYVVRFIVAFWRWIALAAFVIGTGCFFAF